MATIAQLSTETLPHDVVSAVKALLPELRAAQSESDRLARPPTHIVERLREAGAYRLTIPKEYGGLQADMKTWMDTITEIGRGDAGVAWAVTLVASCNWAFSSFFPKHLVDEVFSEPNAALAGIFTGRVVNIRPVKGGIFIDKGTWFFNSGVYEATWDLLGVPMFDEAGEPAGPGIALVPMSDVKLLNDWNTSGIRGSGSTNVGVENLFIPNDRIVPLAPIAEGTQPRAYAGSLPRVAFMPLMASILTYPILGASLHMIETFMETLPRRDIKLTPYTKAAEAPVTHLQIGEATAKIEAARLLIEDGVREMDRWSQGADYMPMPLRARICRDTAFAERLMWEGVDLLASASGGSFSWLSNISNRLWQDVKVGTMHPLVSAPSNYELYGRMLAGIEPPLMLI
ncbi:acyl-CoA dehydrogenase family protein [Nitrospirillum sp. BR 11163]|uniref:acyl-CoA dehydrogenase family protein n=1 Tax=Nitrospirillum sp. BR 11163 TaxID=3104323 RepID=UPI002AFE8F2E|nr:acyl-CoA dehydrogenase family protein [Nitrospirillum sp. BR 11163]MEA1672826.1 acyl-CoA dehydrogenase family protein [Nitrospirillum sp. BR 11163]